jgi:hypothetical protein
MARLCGRRKGLVTVALIGLLGALDEAVASDVTGTWSITPSLLLVEPADVLVQSGTSLTLCVPGLGTVADGTIDPDTGVAVMTYAPSVLFPLYCSLGWTGTFAPDGNSLTATATFVPFLRFPPQCATAATQPITGTRIDLSAACCGNGIVEGGEQCDTGAVGGRCCTGTCQFAASGTSCGPDDGNVCTSETCDATGTCQHVNNTLPCDAGVCTTSGTCADGQCVATGFAAAGSPCEADGNVCTIDGCDGAGHCAIGPPPDCGPCFTCVHPQGCGFGLRTDCSDAAPGSRFTLELESFPPAGKGLAWCWEDASGETVANDFGDPLSSTGYQLCVAIHVQDFPPLVFLLGATAPANEFCAGCWEPIRNGFRFQDLDAFALTSVELSAKPGHPATIRVTGDGTPFISPLPTNIEDLTVVLGQMGPGSRRCWISSFPTLRTSTPTRLTARTP